jgi:molybdopterin-containing oxidoreductase family membrane subunit
VPQILWWKKARTSIPTLFAVSLVVSVGMWLERFVIIVTSLYRDFLPARWGMYYPSFWDWATYIGTFGLFFTLFLLFCRFLPVIAIAEMRELVHHESHHGHASHSHHVEEGNTGDSVNMDSTAHTAEPNVVPTTA